MGTKKAETTKKATNAKRQVKPETLLGYILSYMETNTVPDTSGTEGGPLVSDLTRSLEADIVREALGNV